MSKQEEKQIENQVVSYLISKGHMAIPFENTPTFDPKLGGFRKFKGIPGVSDILVVHCDTAVMGAIEIKRPEVKAKIDRNLAKWVENRLKGHKYSREVTHLLEQHDFIQQVRFRGGNGGFVSGIGDVINLGY